MYFRPFKNGRATHVTPFSRGPTLYECHGHGFFPTIWITRASRNLHVSAQNLIFHQPRFLWHKGRSLTKPPFGVRDPCEVAKIICPDVSTPRLASVSTSRAIRLGSELFFLRWAKCYPKFDDARNCIYHYHGPPKPTFLEVFMVNNLVFRWPKPLLFHGFWGLMVDILGVCVYSHE